MDRIFRVLKRCVHKLLFIKIYRGKKIILYGVPKYVNSNNIFFGKNVRINDNTFFHASNKIIIGDNVTISYGASIITESYVIDSVELYMAREHQSKPIKIGNNVWIGAESIILPGVNIADNVIVGAGSVVTHDLNEEYTIYAGNPAKKIRKYGDKK